MRLHGFLDGQKVRILYDYDGIKYFDIFIRVNEVTFDWEELNLLQQEQILKQLENNKFLDEENYN